MYPRWPDLEKDLTSKVFWICFFILASYLFFCALYFPVNDSDALASYLARFMYAKFGSIDDIATLSIQHTFPETTDWIIWMFAQTGYMAGLPSFICWLAIILSLWMSVSKENRIWATGLALSSPVLMAQSVSQKNDIALSAFFLAGLVLIEKSRNLFTLSIVLGLAALMIGTKWTGIPLAVLLILVCCFSAVKKQALFTVKSFLTTFLLWPVYFFLASGESYLKNRKIYHSFMPILPDMPNYANKGSFSIALGLHSLVFSSYAAIVDVFRIPIHFLEEIKKVKIFEYLSLNHNAYLFQDLFVTSHSSIGYPFGFMFIAALLILIVRPQRFRPYLIYIIPGVIFIFLIISRLSVGGGAIRYLLPAYLVLIPSFAVLLGQYLRQRWMKDVFLGLSIYLAFSNVLYSMERTAPIYRGGSMPVFTSFFYDRELLMFKGLPGYIGFFSDYKKIVKTWNSLLLVDNMVQEDINASEIPHFYPFLVHRSPSNTAIFSRRKASLPTLKGFDFVLVYSRRIEDPKLIGFVLVASTGWKGMNLYKRQE